jgi:uncharacterized membrane protein YfcA
MPFLVSSNHLNVELADKHIGVANLLGGYTGSHLAIAKGSSFIRIFYLIVTGLLIVRLGYSLYLQ